MLLQGRKFGAISWHHTTMWEPSLHGVTAHRTVNHSVQLVTGELLQIILIIS